MNNIAADNAIEAFWKLHDSIEREYIAHPSKKDDARWLEKQRLLLADMAIHLLQTAIAPGEIKLNHLRNNIHAILIVADGFLPHAELKKATEKLIPR